MSEYKLKTIDEAVDQILKAWKDTNKYPVFLTGAGLSASAGVPLWDDVKKDLYKDLFDMDDPKLVEEKYLYDNFCDPVWLKDNVLLGGEGKYANKITDEIEKLREAKKPLPPELVLSFFRKQYGILELQNFLARHYETSKMSASYMSLIKLAELGILKFYITLNQDGLFEKNLARNISPTKFLSIFKKEDFDLVVKEMKTTGLEKTLPSERYIERKRLLVANLHGVFYSPLTLELSPKLLIEPLSQPDPRYDFLEMALSFTNTIIIIGYRGADIDILGALKNILKEKDKIEIFWVSRSGNIPDDILSSSELSHIAKYPISSKSDNFLTCLASAAEEITPRPSMNVLLPIEKDFELICSAKGSLILTGDYGVYINGKMIQLQIPLRVYAIRYTLGLNMDNSYSYDPYLGSWMFEGNTTIEQVREMIKDIKKGELDKWEKKTIRTADGEKVVFPAGFPSPIVKMFQDLKEDILRREDYSSKSNIITFSKFPTASGAGDTLPYVILAAMFLQSSNGEEKLEDLDEKDKNFLVLLSKLYAWRYTYSNASYLRILPTFWNRSPIFMLDRSEAQHKAFADLKIEENENTKDFNSIQFSQMNLLIDIYSVLEKEEVALSINDSVLKDLDFAVAYYPRRAILSKEIAVKTKTSTAVYAVDYKKEKNTLNVLSSLTESMTEAILSKDLVRVGKIMNAGHFGLVALLRGSRLVNELVGALCGLGGIYGAKTSGSGPGGALLIAYSPNEFESLKLRRAISLINLLENFQHQLLLPNVLA